MAAKEVPTTNVNVKLIIEGRKQVDSMVNISCHGELGFSVKYLTVRWNSTDKSARTVDSLITRQAG
jgi:hypothetical protein